MKKSQFFFGFAFILMGALLLAGQFIEGFNAWEIVGMLWPLIFVFIGISSLLTKPRKITSGLIFLTLGGILLTSQFTDFDAWRLWPLIFVIIGVSILFKRDKMGPVNSSTGNSSDSMINSTVAFWGSEIRNTSKDFQGGNLSAAFGGIELDLSDAVISDKGATLNVDAAFAGIEIRVPKDTKVVVKGTGIFGAFENKAKSPSEDNNRVLTITGTAAFAGVEVK